MKRLSKRVLSVVLDILFVGMFIGAAARNMSVGNTGAAILFVTASAVLGWFYIKDFISKTK